MFGALVAAESEQASRLNEEIGGLLGGVTFLVFGAVLLGPALEHLSWQIALYAVLSLTLVRMLPVAIAMLGSGASWQTVGFLGWFGPRGLASIVFAVIVVEEAHLAGTETILLTTYLTIGLSVVRPRDHRRPARAALRALVRIAPAQPPAGDGERGRCTSSIALAARAARLRFGDPDYAAAADSRSAGGWASRCRPRLLVGLLPGGRLLGGLLPGRRVAMGSGLLHRLGTALGLIRHRAVALGDIHQLVGVLLQRLGPSALVDQVAGALSKLLEVHGLSLLSVSVRSRPGGTETPPGSDYLGAARCQTAPLTYLRGR